MNEVEANQNNGILISERYFDVKILVTDIFYSITVILIGEILRRVKNIFFELRYFRKHYNQTDPRKNVLEVVVTSSTRYRSFQIFCFLYILPFMFFISDPNFFKEVMQKIYISIAYIVCIEYGIHKSYLDHAQTIRSGSGIDYASGMASNYFHGYLHLQLPARGDGIKGLVERCEEYEDKHKVEFATKKLIILIPNSLHFKPIIKSEKLISATPLENVVKNRAGVERPFKNDVYKIKIKIDPKEKIDTHEEKKDSKDYYIVLEGATPLTSFYDSCKYNGTSTAEMTTMMREILFQFYKSIQKYCRECPDTKNVVDFIYYNDVNAKGESTDVGEIIENYIKTIISKKDA